MKIRRSGAYGLAGVAALGITFFMPMSTPRWYDIAVFSLACAFAGVAVYFNAQERKAGVTKLSIGFFTLAVLVTIFALLSILPLFL
jgi:hypothetical protein